MRERVLAAVAASLVIIARPHQNLWAANLPLAGGRHAGPKSWTRFALNVRIAARSIATRPTTARDLIARAVTSRRIQKARAGSTRFGGRCSPPAGWNGKHASRKYLAAIEAAKIGNLTMLENFSKKQLCQSWTPTLPDFGDGIKSQGHKTGDVWEVEDSIKILTADFQAGKSGEGSHIWALVTQWDRHGNSRRPRLSQTPDVAAASCDGGGVRRAGGGFR